jgi:protein-S-isoprenylcysteine O-methyltransferase Ste14
VLIAIVFGTPHHLVGDPGLDSLMDALGALVAVLGLAVRGFTVGLEYIVRGGRNHRVYADGLVTGGVYAYTRNPMYLGNGLILLGIAMILNSPLIYAVCLPLAVFAYAAIIAAEEHYLRQKFGSEFDEYCRRVPRLMPRLADLARAPADFHLNWRRVIVKEYGTIFATLLAVFLAALWDDYQLLGPAALPSLLSVVLYVVPLVVLYMLAWVLKKTRILSGDRPVSPSSERTP